MPFLGEGFNSVHWAATLILAQGALVILGVVLIIGLVLLRRWQKSRNDIILPLIQEQVTNIACELPFHKEFMLSLKGYRRRKLRGYILSAISGISGDARQRLSDIYHEAGFSRDDYKDLKHKDFAYRLAAIARLEVVMDREAMMLVKPLLRDSSPYVHFAALRFVLKQNKAHEPKIEAEMQLAAIINRFDIAREILDCYVKNHREGFMQLLRTVTNPKIRDVCLDIVLKNKITEAIPIIQDHLLEALRSEGHQEYAQFEFKKYIHCLTLSPLPDSEDLLLKMTEIDQALIRYSAYQALFRIRPDLKSEYLETLLNDLDPHIVRLGVQIREEQIRSEAA